MPDLNDNPLDMQGKKQYRFGPPVALGVVLLVGLVVRVFLVARDRLELIRSVCADDMFYYLKIAQQIAAGNGATFDGIHPTNGFHPLYMLILVPLFRVFSDPHAVMTAALWLLQLLSLLTAVLVYRLVLRATRSRAAGIAAAFAWAANPHSAAIAATGVEVPIAVLFMTLAADRYLAWKEKEEQASGSDAAVVGLLLGLAVLSRTDQIITTLVVFGEGALVLWLGRKRGRRIRGAWTAPVAWILVTAPWWAWNLLRFGTIGQSSGSAILYTSHQTVLRGADSILWTAASQIMRKTWEALVNNGLELAGMANPWVALALILSLAATYLMLRRGSPRPSHPAGAFRKLAFLFVAVVGLWGVYPIVFWQIRAWYFLPVVLGLSVAAGLGTAAFVKRAPEKPAARALLAGVGLLVFVAANFAWSAYRIQRDGLAPWQTTYYRVARGLADGRIEAVPAGARIGAFNAGILSFFSGRNVVNLDGVTNNEILPVLRDRSLYRYLIDRDIRFLIDHEQYIWGYGMFADPGYRRSLRLLHRFETPPFAGEVVAVEIRAP